ncbi:hypothetical protein SAMN02745194_04451 [Roseomonas rosea]|uniref:Transcriptional regulator TetR C-terminal Proteobacteria type domain-containing protein n=1 Tax=Muricoccus roseus TaxID=198092 RepID=A0A1M6QNE0_9PROT|nr:hypothetical protein SAMN02745194_04451 [Roseomonas rosea]
MQPGMMIFTPEEGDNPRSSLTALLLMAAERLLGWKQIGMFRLISAEGKRSPKLARAFHRAGPRRGIAGALHRRACAEGQAPDR